MQPADFLSLAAIAPALSGFLGVMLTLRTSAQLSRVERYIWLGLFGAASILVLVAGAHNTSHDRWRDAQLAEYAKLPIHAELMTPKAPPKVALALPPPGAADEKARRQLEDRARTLALALIRFATGNDQHFAPGRPENEVDTPDQLHELDRLELYFTQNFRTEFGDVLRAFAALGIKDPDLEAMRAGPMIPPKFRLMAKRLNAMADQL